MYILCMSRWCTDGRERWYAAEQDWSTFPCCLCSVMGSEVCVQFGLCILTCTVLADDGLRSSLNFNAPFCVESVLEGIYSVYRDTAVPAEGNGDWQTLIFVLVARPRRCLTLSNPVPWQNWMTAYLGYTLQMKTLFRGWPVMVHDTHTRRRIQCLLRLHVPVDCSNLIQLSGWKNYV